MHEFLNPSLFSNAVSVWGKYFNPALCTWEHFRWVVSCAIPECRRIRCIPILSLIYQIASTRNHPLDFAGRKIY